MIVHAASSVAMSPLAMVKVAIPQSSTGRSL